MDPAAIYRATATGTRRVASITGSAPSTSSTRRSGAVDRAWDQIDDVAIQITAARRRSWAGAALHEATARETGLDYESIWRA